MTTQTLLTDTVEISGHAHQCYTEAQARRYFEVMGDANPDIYEHLGWWCNANDGLAVLSAEHAREAGFVVLTERDDSYEDEVRGADLWWDDRSYADYQIGDFD